MRPKLTLRHVFLLVAVAAVGTTGVKPWLVKERITPQPYRSYLEAETHLGDWAFVRTPQKVIFRNCTDKEALSVLDDESSSIRWVEIHSSQPMFSSNVYRKIGALPGLSRLTVHHSVDAITLVNLTGGGQNRNIRLLDIFGEFVDKDLRIIEHMNGLTELRIYGTHVVGYGLHNLARIPDLWKVVIESDKADLNVMTEQAVANLKFSKLGREQLVVVKTEPSLNPIRMFERADCAISTSILVPSA